MHVRVKLFATLGRYRPGSRPGTPFDVELPDGATLAGLLAAIHVPDAEVRVVFINGRTQPLDWQLWPGDEVGIFPPVGGG